MRTLASACSGSGVARNWRKGPGVIGQSPERAVRVHEDEFAELWPERGMWPQLDELLAAERIAAHHRLLEARANPRGGLGEPLVGGP